MTREEFDSFCSTLPASTHVVQWRGASVWKVGGKMFAIGSNPGGGRDMAIRFKCSETAYEVLCQQQGIIPAPHLARAGWVQVLTPEAMSDADTRLYLKEAHRLIAARLSRAVQADLGL